MKKIVLKGMALLIVIGLLICLAIFIKYLRQPKEKRYYVDCDDRFQVGLTDHMYMPGYDVPLIFPIQDTNTSYSFQVDGVDQFTANYYSGIGYLIMFEMPKNKVKVTYQEQSKECKEVEDEIGMVLYENPSTGFLWEYEQSQEGVLEIMEDKYVSDPSNPKKPTTGKGGQHFFRFKVIGSGTIEIQFTYARGDEIADEMIYTYECDQNKATKKEE